MASLPRDARAYNAKSSEQHIAQVLLKLSLHVLGHGGQQGQHILLQLPRVHCVHARTSGLTLTLSSALLSSRGRDRATICGVRATTSGERSEQRSMAAVSVSAAVRATLHAHARQSCCAPTFSPLAWRRQGFDERRFNQGEHALVGLFSSREPCRRRP